MLVQILVATEVSAFVLSLHHFQTIISNLTIYANYKLQTKRVQRSELPTFECNQESESAPKSPYLPPNVDLDRADRLPLPFADLKLRWLLAI
jgi:hypothetical protein